MQLFNKFQEINEEIDKKISVYEIAQHLGLKKGSGSTDAGSFSCPFHEDGSASFVAKRGMPTWKCLSGCGTGNIFQLIEKFRNCNYNTALDEILGLVGIDKKQLTFMDRCQEVLVYAKPLQEIHKKYLSVRGYNETTIKRLSDKLKTSGKYIIFPEIKNAQIVSYKHISINNKRDKYFKGNDCGCMFYPNNNFNNVENLVLTAGEWDCEYLEEKLLEHPEKYINYKVISTSTGEASYPVDTLYQLNKKNAPKLKAIHIFYDKDQAGKEGALKIADKLLSLDLQIYIYLFPENKPEGYDLSDFFKDGQSLENLFKIEYFKYDTAKNNIPVEVEESENEKSLLLFILYNPHFLHETNDFNLRVNDFKDWRYQAIYKKILEYSEKGNFGYCDIDLLKVREKNNFELLGAIDEIIGSRLIGTIEEMYVIMEEMQINSYDKALELVLNKMKIQQHKKGSVKEKHSRLTNIFSDLELEASFKVTSKFMGDILDQYVNSYNTKDVLRYISTPFTEINEITNGGLRLGKIHLLTAPVSMGKTTFASDFADHASEQGVKTKVYIGESDYEEVSEQFLAKRNEVDNYYFKRRITPNGETPLSQRRKADRKNDYINLEYQELYKYNFQQIIDDMRASARKGVKFIILDQLNSLKKEGKGNRKDFYTDCVMSLKDLAGELGICILILCQLTREGGKAGNKKSGKAGFSNKPGAEDLADTADLERLAYTIMIITSDSRKDANVKILFPKNRNGVADTEAELIFKRPFSRFYNDIPNFRN